MNSKRGGHNEWEFPHLREAFRLPVIPNAKHRNVRISNEARASNSHEFWAVQFYPYTKPGVDPVYAVVGGRNILVCRPPASVDKSIEIIQVILDEAPDADHYTCAWSKEVATGKPLLCVAGADAKIKVFDVESGECRRILTGHGGEILQLVVSPQNPEILASASEDQTIRVWSLNPAHIEEPCLVLLDSHQETVQTVAFHDSGRYLLSAGNDHLIKLWVLPDFTEERAQPVTILWPHFSTSEIHGDPVDCVAFYHDLILSRAANEDCIVLWAVDGFDSADTPPPLDGAPTSHDPSQNTVSGFKRDTSTEAYKRLIEFSAPGTDTLTMRFSLFPGNPSSPTSSNPILACGSAYSKIYFWDLARLESYCTYITSLPPIDQLSSPAHIQPKRPAFLHTLKTRQPSSRSKAGGHGYNSNSSIPARIRDASPSTESTTSNSNSLTSSITPAGSVANGSNHLNPNNAPTSTWIASPSTERDVENWDKKYQLGIPNQKLLPHKEEVVKTLNFLGRQVAWSTGGEWCVVVGSGRCMGIFSRWDGLMERERERDKETERGRAREREY